ncbi:ketose-bisphosphate aldolase class-II [Gemmatirosa kalamazoonensis]|uniref:Ketose-bisphosphate aldolase class-II n=1 Tax=Gemmatirosa kalamazoonensis TaxID=861299 RepID=W0RI04_9BACT|nr:class II fructose-bisphosphate aldolase [Gemmatirosa kalamazoonensis]AHG90411.1 ketose-bisphosphate aldolase class-II [Gemmatirosa kalamazoonensis]
MATQVGSENQLLGGAVTVQGGRVSVVDERALATEALDPVVRQAVFGTDEEKEFARWLLWEIGQAVGVRPASIHELYMARGRGDVHGFTVPAMNIRAMTYDTVRSIIRTANKLDAGAFILEIARSEIAYTDQRPAEYVSVIIGAALREGYRGPLFIQGDHFQVNAKKFAVDAVTEVNAVKQLAVEAIHAGFYNIDIDTSTLVDLSKQSLDEQQRLNYETAVQLTQYVRSLEPQGVTISIGGEIGEVGTENSTPEELHAFMKGYNQVLSEVAPGMPGLSKISVQSGTSHGGTVLPDGSIADVALDIDTLRTLGEIARKEYGMSGAVQHGASTLPDSKFNLFPQAETAEIHLATNFQNMMYDHLPNDLRREMYGWLDTSAKDERKATDTDEQFYYKSRKKAIGPFKKQLWALPADVKATLAGAYDAKFEFLFTQLGVQGTRSAVKKFVTAPEQHRPMPTSGRAAVEAAPDDADLSD